MTCEFGNINEHVRLRAVTNATPMNNFGTIIGTVILLGWLGVCLWSWLKPAPPAQDAGDEADRDRQIGFIIGMMGGTVEAAAQVRYAISRLEEQLGRKATVREIATAVGVKLGTDA